MGMRKSLQKFDAWLMTMCSECKHYEDDFYIIGWCKYLEVTIICPCCDTCCFFEEKNK